MNWWGSQDQMEEINKAHSIEILEEVWRRENFEMTLSASTPWPRGRDHQQQETGSGDMLVWTNPEDLLKDKSQHLDK